MRRYLPFIIVALVAAAAVGSGVVLYRAELAELAPKPINPADEEAGALSPHYRGEAQAPVTLEEFGDFQCPPCADLWPVLSKIEQDYGARLKVIFRQYPLKMHQHADLAARAAEAASLQNRFWEMHDLLYRNQAIWSKSVEVEGIFNKYAFGVGLEIERFKADLKSEAVELRIATDRKRADSLGVRSTPSILINNKLLAPSSVNEAGLRSAIDAALAESSALVTPTPLAPTH